MTDFTPAEIAKLKEERSLASNQINFLQTQIREYGDQITKE